MIEKLELKFGSSPHKAPLTLEPTPITVFVGPNNSGKSKAISEISINCQQLNNSPLSVIVNSVIFKNNIEEEALRIIKRIQLFPPKRIVSHPDHIFILNNGGINEVPLPALLNSLINPNLPNNKQNFINLYMSSRTLVLNGHNRIGLIDDQGGGDLQEPPHTSLQKLFRDDNLRQQYRELVHRSLQAFPVVDPTRLGVLRLRLSKVQPISPDIERGLLDASVQFHSDAIPISESSDGARSFTGILAEIMTGDPQILLMDEPEAFLHPSLAFNLGRDISVSLSNTNKQMFVSTHSAQFVMGCIQSGVPINVVRLTYRNGIATARLLPSAQIVNLMRNPLLRSTGVLSALFYESAVVTEGDADRAFYQEINERLLQVGRGIPNCIFLNAQNKQTIPTIIDPLRKLGIPAAAIYDIDFVKDGGGIATKFMDTAGIPKLIQQGLTINRSNLKDELLRSNSKYKKEGGIEVLSGSDRLAANDYFDQLDSYGAFVVRSGELESWLKSLGATGHGPPWLIEIFEKMGEDPQAAGYTNPSDDDVWQFIGKIGNWLSDPARKGIPD